MTLSALTLLTEREREKFFMYGGCQLLGGMKQMKKTNGVGENSSQMLFLPPQIPSKLPWDQTHAFINSNSCKLFMFHQYNNKK